MFSRNDKSKTASNTGVDQQTKARVPSIMSSDLVLTGNIVSDGEVQIDGEVVGDIKSSVLLVGESAKIKGEIFADTIHIHGSINGQIKAKTVHLAKTAHVVGDILHENLSIDEGAFIEGHITRMHDVQSMASDERVNLVISKPEQQRLAGKGPTSVGTTQSVNGKTSDADKKAASGT